jgi:hypothetical protein
MGRWLVRSRLLAKTNGYAVPAVNRNDRQRKIRQFLFVELFARLIIGLVRNVIGRDQGRCFRPCQSRSFPFAVIGRLSPGHEVVKSLLASSLARASLLCIIDAIGAAVICDARSLIGSPNEGSIMLHPEILL